MSVPGNNLFRRLSGLLTRQEVRYLIAGGWNTMFGLGVFCGLLRLLHPPLHYMVVQAVANVLAVTMAYATYKLFVFRTKGNVVREYLKVWGVYGAAILFGMAALPLCVEGLKMNPYLAAVLITAVTVVASYFGHKHFSFRRRPGA
jgi:putative flippase GtrA